VQVTIAAAAAVTTESTPGAGITGVVVGATGTRYQITTDFDPGSSTPTGPTRVSILAADGRVLHTSQDITGALAMPIPAKRADGSLVLATYDQATDTTFVSVINSQGTVTPAGSVAGLPVSPPSLASNGAVFLLAAGGLQTSTPTYKLMRVSSTNQSQTYDIGQTAFPPTVAPNGYVYLPTVTTTGSTTKFSFLVIAPDGTSSSTTPIDGAASTVVTLGSDGTPYGVIGTINPAQTAYVTKLYTFQGSSSTVRDIPGFPTTVVAGQGGKVYTLTFANDGTNTAHVSTITATTLTPSDTISGNPIAQISVAPDGTVYTVVSQAGVYKVAAVRPAGVVVDMVTIPGNATLLQTASALGYPVGTNSTVYVPYSDASGNYFVAAVHGSAIVSTPMPTGATISQPVVVGPNGAAYQVVGTATGTSVVVLSSGVSTAEIGGSISPTNILGAPVVVGPDGKGYLITQDGTVTRVLVFGPTGNTVASFSGSGTAVPAYLPGGPFGFTTQSVVFDNSGTAYVSISTGPTSSEPAHSEVWRITSSGATKVLDLDSPLGSAVTIGQDGATAYATVGDANAAGDNFVTTVHVVSPTII
jgi:hypothetical protein